MGPRHKRYTQEARSVIHQMNPRFHVPPFILIIEQLSELSKDDTPNETNLLSHALVAAFRQIAFTCLTASEDGQLKLPDGQDGVGATNMTEADHQSTHVGSQEMHHGRYAALEGHRLPHKGGDLPNQVTGTYPWVGSSYIRIYTEI